MDTYNCLYHLFIIHPAFRFAWHPTHIILHFGTLYVNSQHTMYFIGSIGQDKSILFVIF